MLFGVPLELLYGQILLGLVNGSFYAILSLGLAVIFGMLHIINFAHGALYMFGAFLAWMMAEYLGIGFWPAIVIAPLVVGLLSAAFEIPLLRPLYRLIPLYGLLATFGLALVLQGAFREIYGVSGMRYSIPEALQGGVDVGFMFLPIYRIWVVAASLLVCAGTWYLIEKTRYGIYIRAAEENAPLVRTFGIPVSRLVTLTYASGAALAAFAGVLAAPIYSVNAMMGADIIILVFAIVVIGGMGSIRGPIIAGYALGLIEGLTKTYFPEAANTVVFVFMVMVLLVRPAGLFGRAR